MNKIYNEEKLRIAYTEILTIINQVQYFYKKHSKVDGNNMQNVSNKLNNIYFGSIDERNTIQLRFFELLGSLVDNLNIYFDYDEGDIEFMYSNEHNKTRSREIKAKFKDISFFNLRYELFSPMGLFETIYILMNGVFNEELCMENSYYFLSSYISYRSATNNALVDCVEKIWKKISTPDKIKMCDFLVDEANMDEEISQNYSLINYNLDNDSYFKYYEWSKICRLLLNFCNKYESISMLSQCSHTTDFKYIEKYLPSVWSLHDLGFDVANINFNNYISNEYTVYSPYRHRVPLTTAKNLLKIFNVSIIYINNSLKFLGPDKISVELVKRVDTFFKIFGLTENDYITNLAKVILSSLTAINNFEKLASPKFNTHLMFSNKVDDIKNLIETLLLTFVELHINIREILVEKKMFIDDFWMDFRESSVHNDALNKILSRKLDGKFIAHYTSLTGLKLILEDNSLQFSELTSMNDELEGKLLASIFNDTTEHKWINDRKLAFSLSFTHKFDSLDLWGNYTNFKGVSLVFASNVTESIKQFSSRVKYKIKDDIYSEFYFTRSANSFDIIYSYDKILWLHHFSTNLFDLFKDKFQAHVYEMEAMCEIITNIKDVLSSLFKTPPFEYEKEIRVIVNARNLDSFKKFPDEFITKTFSFSNDNNGCFSVKNEFDPRKLIAIYISPLMKPEEIIIVNELVEKYNNKNKTNVNIYASDCNFIEDPKSRKKFN